MRRNWRSFIQPDNAISTNRNGSREWAIPMTIMPPAQRSVASISVTSIGSSFRTQRAGAFGRSLRHHRNHQSVSRYDNRQATKHPKGLRTDTP